MLAPERPGPAGKLLVRNRPLAPWRKKIAWQLATQTVLGTHLPGTLEPNGNGCQPELARSTLDWMARLWPWIFCPWCVEPKLSVNKKTSELARSWFVLNLAKQNILG